MTTNANGTTQPSSLVVGLLLTVITIVALGAVGKTAVLSPLDQVLLIISGMTTIAALAAFDHYRKFSISIKPSSLNRQRTFIQKLFGRRFQDESELFLERIKHINDVEKQSYQQNNEAEIEAVQTVKFIISRIKKELERIANSSGIDLDDHELYLAPLLSLFIERNILSESLLKDLKNFQSDFNQAASKQEVSQNIVELLRSSSQILAQLQQTTDDTRLPRQK